MTLTTSVPLQRWTEVNGERPTKTKQQAVRPSERPTLKTTAAITRMKARERIGGVPVQLRDDPAARDVGLHKYDRTRFFRKAPHCSRKLRPPVRKGPGAEGKQPEAHTKAILPSK
jgi:hypothetical protein